MALEVAQRERGQGLLASEFLGLGDPLVEQHVGVLLAAARPAADQPLELGVDGDVAHAEALRLLDPRQGQRLGQLRAQERLTGLQRPSEHLVAAGEDSVVEAGLPVPVPVRGVDTGRAEGEQPANVSRRDEVPGGTQDVGPQDFAAAEGLLDVGVGAGAGALGDRPFRLGVLLSLHGAEPADDLRGGVERLAGQALLMHPPMHDGEVVEGHFGVTSGELGR